MNPRTVDGPAPQRHRESAADARGDGLPAGAGRESDDETGPRSWNGPAAHLARSRFTLAIRRPHSPAREASGGRF